MNIRFRRPSLDDAQLLLEWRSSPAINDMMFTDVRPGAIAEQRAWLQRCSERNDYEHFVIMGDGEPVGYLSYSAIDRVNGSCSCGSYFGTVEAGRKYGGYVHAYFMDYLFYGLNLRKNIIQVIDINKKVIRIQQKLRMREVGVLKEHVLKNGVFRDVYIFELLKSEWQAKRWAINTIEDSLAAFAE